MTPREKELFVQGMLFGATLAFAQERQAVAAFDERIKKVERQFVRPQPRIRLVPAGWRDGRPVFFAGRYA
jgi:hypothetical protein